MTQTVERRYTREAVAFRAADGPGVGNMHGYAAKYERLSQNLGGFVEQVGRSAFAKSLGDNLDVLARYNHDDNALLGRTASGTLTLESDDTGLLYDVTLPDTTVGRDVAALARRGDVYQSSFAFYTLEDDWSVTENGFPLRTLIAVRLVDVAPVNTPAYLDTSTAVRSLAERVHLAVEEIPSVPTDEIRNRLTNTSTVIDLAANAATSETVEPQEVSQRDSHGPLAIARLRLAVNSRRIDA